MNAQVLQGGWDAVAVDPRDTVAVAMRSLEPGKIAVRVGQDIRALMLIEPVGIGHKIALLRIAAEEEVRKYGEIIGVATTAIDAGAHVHVHNLKSRRAKAKKPA